MAYYYTFSVKESNDKIKEIVKYMKTKNRECEWFYPFFNDLFMLDTAELHDKLELKSDELELMYVYHDIFELSRQFPESVFCMRNSDDGLDFELDYFKNGKIQRCVAIITFDEYDESKLEEMI